MQVEGPDPGVVDRDGAAGEALRAQLAGTGVRVTELVPPAVATAGQERVNPAALLAARSRALDALPGR